MSQRDQLIIFIFRSDADIIQWQEHVCTHTHNNLFCFVGAKRAYIKKDFRGLLLNQCKAAPASCQSVDFTRTKCSNGSSAVILKTFLDSKSCLQPRGDNFTCRSIFDCMVTVSIPVLFWKRIAYS